LESLRRSAVFYKAGAFGAQNDCRSLIAPVELPEYRRRVVVGILGPLEAVGRIAIQEPSQPMNALLHDMRLRDARLLAALLFAAALAASGWCRAGDMPSAANGVGRGTEIPSFYVREVTGSRPNQAICLVCRYGARPAVLVCVRAYDDHVRELLVKLDRAVDAHRAQGLRGFAIFLDAEPQKLQPQLFNLARRENLSLPLTFPVETAGPSSLELPKSTQVTVLLYRQKKVVQRIEVQPDHLDEEQIARIVTAAKEFGQGTK
jgi:hypothetical protein